MYKNILVPISLDHSPHSQQALEIAKALADESAKITALHVVEDVPRYVAHYLPDDHFINRRTEAEADLKADLSGNPEIKHDVVTGHPGVTIVNYATEHEYDCIVIASHRPGIQDYFLGSTAQRVVRYAPCAVHVVR